jgi:FAD:protein FMN transferase
MSARASSARRPAGGGGVAVAARDEGEGVGGAIVRLAIAAMGTRFEIVLCAAPDQQASRRHLHAVGELAIEEIRLAHQRLSAFEPASLVSAINRQAGAGAIVVDPDTFGLLALAAEVNHASGGAFDITLGPLMRAWGFRGGSGAPDPAAVDAARQVCGMGLLMLDPATRRARLTCAGAQLDLGAIAKGHALDLAADVLRQHGVSSALLHGGTSAVLALGAPPGAAGWRIALADRGRRLGLEVMLRDQFLSVSSPAGRLVEAGGATWGHILDPRTGEPARGARFAAALTPAGAPSSGALADAWSTALLVCGKRPASALGEITSLILPACAGDWRLEGPAAAFTFERSGADGGPEACLTWESNA